ncbi:helix-turn-helix transcriptional regulator [Novosphingobium sp. CF614]|uniref:helix-turn-helix domain-containing protein n=1 Tax=Novosphingobium sp. CF614 TaxID=1884364 RepID=UPI000B89ECAA|nr:helix-turn-helix transcriptional regulator [Novosphingobium sp. CF614]
MSAEGEDRRERPGVPEAGLLRTFSRLTAKQHEVLRFVAENRTSKEIAWELGISESAVNQRIEGVRIRTGSPPRAELARAYRQYQQDLEAQCKPRPDDIAQAPEPIAVRHVLIGSELDETFVLPDAAIYTFTDPWPEERAGRIFPKLRDGPHAGLSRTAALIAIVAGILLIAVAGLAVADALRDLF